MIYALVDPFSKEIRYIGKSVSGLKRPNEKHSSHCENWRMKLRRMGRLPNVIVVQEFPVFLDVEKILAEAETYWINHFRERGCPLTNIVDETIFGGTGRKDSPETKAKRNASLREMYKRNPLLKKKISERRKGISLSKEQRERLREVNSGKKLTLSTRMKMSAAHLGKKKSEETKKKMSIARCKRFNKQSAAK